MPRRACHPSATRITIRSLPSVLQRTEPRLVGLADHELPRTATAALGWRLLHRSSPALGGRGFVSTTCTSTNPRHHRALSAASARTASAPALAAERSVPSR